MYTRISNNCAICGTQLRQFTEHTFTAHEFNCYKREPDRVPERDKEEFKELLQWEARSIRAKSAAAKRRRSQ